MDTETKPSTLELVQSEDFKSVYANHIQFETSGWDLRIRFGQLDQKLGQNTVVEHTAVTIPWAQVKLMAYLLRVNLAIHEHLNGRITIPPGIIANEELIRKAAEQYRNSEGVTAEMLKLFKEFVEENPEAIGEPYLATPKDHHKRK